MYIPLQAERFCICKLRLGRLGCDVAIRSTDGRAGRTVHERRGTRDADGYYGRTVRISECCKKVSSYRYLIYPNRQELYMLHTQQTHTHGMCSLLIGGAGPALLFRPFRLCSGSLCRYCRRLRAQKTVAHRRHPPPPCGGPASLTNPGIRPAPSCPAGQQSCPC